MIGNPVGSLEEKLLWMRHKQAMKKAELELERLRKRVERARKPQTSELVRQMRVLSDAVTDRNAQRIQALLDSARAKERKRA
jgi:hypothetical protein